VNSLPNKKIDKNEIRILRAMGYEYSEIGEKMNCSRQYAYMVCTQEDYISANLLCKINNLILKGYSIEDIRDNLNLGDCEIFRRKMLYKKVKYPVLRNYVIVNYGTYKNFCDKIGYTTINFCAIINGSGRVKKPSKYLISLIKKETGIDEKIFLRESTNDFKKDVI
jgi:hypothetical protein